MATLARALAVREYCAPDIVTTLTNTAGADGGGHDFVTRQVTDPECHSSPGQLTGMPSAGPQHQVPHAPEYGERLSSLTHSRSAVDEDHRLQGETSHRQPSPAGTHGPVQRDTPNHQSRRCHERGTLHDTRQAVRPERRPPPCQLKNGKLHQAWQRVPDESDRRQVRVTATDDVVGVGHSARSIGIEQVVTHHEQVADCEVQHCQHREQQSSGSAAAWRLDGDLRRHALRPMLQSGHRSAADRRNNLCRSRTTAPPTQPAATEATVTHVHHFHPSPGYSSNSAPPSRTVRLTLWPADPVATTSPVSDPIAMEAPGCSRTTGRPTTSRRSRRSREPFFHGPRTPG